MQSACMYVGDGRLLLALHTRGAPSTSEWDDYLALARTAESAEQGHVERIRGLVVTDGGSPDALQRAQLSTVLDGRRVRSAVLTPNTMIRMVVRALLWINQDAEMRVYAPGEYATAGRFLGLSPSERQGALTVLHLLQRKMEEVSALTTMLE